MLSKTCDESRWLLFWTKERWFRGASTKESCRVRVRPRDSLDSRRRDAGKTLDVTRVLYISTSFLAEQEKIKGLEKDKYKMLRKERLDIDSIERLFTCVWWRRKESSLAPNASSNQDYNPIANVNNLFGIRLSSRDRLLTIRKRWVRVAESHQKSVQ